ncbi:hypothetical protein ABZ208_08190 [Streptomyces sp. NPDC006208]|uniref:hypothetical protein n=1 Tax=Streptomyces sp. NPDC006208 TaxID=3156734 RepID=UPI0033B33F6E
MRLRTTEFRPRLDGREYRVVRPRTSLRRTTYTDWRDLTGDHEGLSQLAGYFSFAAYSPHTLVHLPLGELDLVLGHRRSPGLRVSSWPQLRRRLVRGRPLTVTTDERRTAADAAAWAEQHDRAKDHDRLFPARYARTLFLTGSREVLASAAMRFAHAAGFGSHTKPLVIAGHRMPISSLVSEMQLHWDVDRTEVAIHFRGRPEHSRPAVNAPGAGRAPQPFRKPASRRSPTAA